MKSYFPKKIKTRRSRQTLWTELLQGLRCHGCLVKFKTKCGKKTWVRGRAVNIKSNFGANLALRILRHHRNIFMNETPIDNRFTNTSSFKMCSTHHLQFSKIFKGKKVRTKDRRFSFLKQSLENSNSQVTLNSQESVRSDDFFENSQERPASNGSDISEPCDAVEEFQDSGNFETCSIVVSAEVTSEVEITNSYHESDDSDDEYVPRLVPEPGSGSDEENEEEKENEEIIVPVFWRSVTGAKKELKTGLQKVGYMTYQL